MVIARIIGMVLLLIFLILAVGPFLVPVPPLQNTRPPEELADPDSLFVEIDGLKLHYKQTGQGKPALILLHGFGASLFSWREVMAPLSVEWRVVAYDRPAFGLTERPIPAEWQGQNPYSLSTQPDLLFALMDSLGIEQAVLVGNSAGGTVAVQAALEKPDRVRGLVLVDAAIYAGGGSPSWLRPLIHTPQMDHLGPLIVRSIQTRGEDLITTAWHDPAQITPEVRAGYRKPLQGDHWDRALWELTKASQPGNLGEQVDLLKMPVLVITGDDDRIVPTEQSLRLAQAIPQAGLAVIPECGHVPQEECPQAFLDAVLPFIHSLKDK